MKHKSKLSLTLVLAEALLLSASAAAQYSSYYEVTKVNAKEAAVLVQSNIANSGAGLLDFTGPFAQLINRLSLPLRQNELARKDKETAAHLKREILDPLDAIAAELAQLEIDLTNADLNGNFALKNTLKFIALFNRLGRIIHNYPKELDAEAVADFYQLKKDLEYTIRQAKIIASHR